MHMVRTRPFQLTRDLDTLFQSATFQPGRGDTRSRAWMPRVDVYEVDNTLNLRFELAGFAADDLEVTLEEGLLKVSGSRSFEVPESAEVHRQELASGSFSRTVRVTDAYAAEGVGASFSNGLLHVTLEKRPEVLPRTIEIEAL